MSLEGLCNTLSELQLNNTKDTRTRVTGQQENKLRLALRRDGGVFSPPPSLPRVRPSLAELDPNDWRGRRAIYKDWHLSSEHFFDAPRTRERRRARPFIFRMRSAADFVRASSSSAVLLAVVALLVNLSGGVDGAALGIDFGSERLTVALSRNAR